MHYKHDVVYFKLRFKGTNYRNTQAFTAEYFKPTYDKHKISWLRIWLKCGVCYNDNILVPKHLELFSIQSGFLPWNFFSLLSVATNQHTWSVSNRSCSVTRDKILLFKICASNSIHRRARRSHLHISVYYCFVVLSSLHHNTQNSNTKATHKKTSKRRKAVGLFHNIRTPLQNKR
jgi:hypothetical protein